MVSQRDAKYKRMDMYIGMVLFIMLLSVGLVYAIGPTANAGSDDTIDLGNSVSLSGSASSCQSCTITSYNWNFGDDTGGSGLSVTHTYTTTGNFDAVLTVIDNFGNIDSDTVRVTVQNVDSTPPTINHTDVVNGTNATQILISATITDDVSISSVKLYYRINNTDASFTELDITSSQTGDSFSGTIPSASVHTNGTQYYLTAQDSSTNIRYYPTGAQTNATEAGLNITVTASDTIAPTTSLVSVANDTTTPYWDNVDDNQTDIIVQGEPSMDCRYAQSELNYSQIPVSSQCSTAGGNSRSTCSIELSQAANITEFIICQDANNNTQTTSENVEVTFGVDYTAPSISSVTATALPSNKIQLNFSASDSVSGVSSIKAYRSMNSSDAGDLISTLQSGTTSFVDANGSANLVSGINYYYTLLPVDAAGNQLNATAQVIKQSNSLGEVMSISHDKDRYICSPLCTAYINVTNTKSNLAGTVNMRFNNTVSASGADIDMYWKNFSSGTYIKLGTNDSINNSFEFKLFNESDPTNSTNEFRFDINMTGGSAAKWDWTFTVSGTQTFTLDPPLDTINYTSPANSSTTSDTTPSFVFTYYSSNSSSQSCGLFLTNDTVAFNETNDLMVINQSVSINTSTTLTVPSALAQATYDWRVGCNGTGSFEYGEVRSLMVLTGNKSLSGYVSKINLSGELEPAAGITVSLINNSCTELQSGHWWRSQPNLPCTVETTNITAADGSYMFEIESIPAYTLIVGEYSNQSDNLTLVVADNIDINLVTSKQVNFTLHRVSTGTSLSNDNVIYANGSNVISTVHINYSGANETTWNVTSYLDNGTAAITSTNETFYLNHTGVGTGNTYSVNATIPASYTNSSMWICGGIQAATTALGLNISTMNESEAGFVRGWYVNRVLSCTNVTIDSVFPAIASANLSDNVTTNNTFVNATILVTELNLRNVTVDGKVANLSSGANISDSSSLHWALIELTDNRTNVTVVANDVVGRSTTSTISFAIDDSAPTVNYEAPPNSTVAYISSPVTLTWNTSETNPGWCAVYLNTTVFENFSAPSGQYSNSTALGTGFYNWSVTCEDQSGNRNASPLSFFQVDADLPTILNGYLNNSFFDNNTDVNITALVDVDLSNVSGVTFTTFYTYNNQAMTALNSSQNNSWAFNATLRGFEGNNTMNITATDGAGNTNTTTIIFNIDTTGPTIASANISDNITNNNTQVNVTVVATDDGGGIKNVNVNPAGINLTMNYSGGVYWAATVLYANLTSLNISTTDNAGRETSVNRTYATDDTNPSLLVISPVNESFTGNPASVVFNVTETYPVSCEVFFSTAAGPLASYENVTLNNTADQQVNIPLGNLTDNNYNWSVSCLDEASNTGVTGNTIFTIDAINPVFVAVYPAAQSFVIQSGTNTTFQVNATDNVSGVGGVFLNSTTLGTVSLLTDGTVNQTWNGSIFLNGSDGTNQMNITIVDLAGNKNVTNYTYIIDDTAPTIAQVTVNDTVINNNTNVTITANVTDTNTILNVTINNTQSNFTVVNGLYELNITATYLTNPILIRAVDEAGNVQWDNTSASVIIDDAAPGVILSSPFNGSFSSNPTNLTFDVENETAATFNQCNVYVNETSYANVTTANATSNTTDVWNFSVSLPVTDGQYNWSVTCTDNAENINSSGVSFFTVDTTAPSITGAALNDTVFQNNSWITVEVNATDVDSNVSLVTADGLTMTNVTGNNETWQLSINLNGTNSIGTDGNYTVNITVFDLAGNSNTTTIAYTLDNTAPVLQLYTGNDIYVLMSQNVTQDHTNVSVFINISDVNTVTTVVGENVSFNLVNGSVWNGTILIHHGEQPVNIMMVDEAGNVGWNNDTDFVVDDNATIIGLNFPVNGSFGSNPVEFNFSAANETDFTYGWCAITVDENATAVANLTNTNFSASNGNMTFSLAISEAAHNWSVACTDVAGNTANSGISFFTVDSVDPIFSAISINDSVIKNSSYIEINVTVNGTGSNVVSVTAEGVAMTPHNASVNLTWNVNVSVNASAEGSNFMNLSLFDQANNNNWTLVEYVLDVTAPSINSVVLSQNATQNNTAVNVTVNVTDTNNVSTVTAEGIALTQTNVTSIWIGEVNLTYGTQPINVFAEDEAGNKAYDNNTDFTIDDNGTTLNITFPGNNSFATNPTLLNFTALNETADTFDYCTVYVDYNGTHANHTANFTNANFTATGGLFVFNVTLNDATHNWTVRCTDVAGNTADSGFWFFGIDEQPPAITTISLNDTIFKNGSVIFVEVNTTDIISNAVSVTIQGKALTPRNASNESWTGNITIEATGDQLINLSVVARDTATNEQTNVTLIEADNTAATISSVTLNQSVVHNNTNVTANITATDKNGLLLITAEGVTNNSPTNGSTLIEITLIELQSPVNVLVEDNAGNKAWLNTTGFIVDDVAPAINFTFPGQGIATNDSTPNLQFVINDSGFLLINTTVNATINDLFYNLSNMTYTQNGEFFTFNFSPVTAIADNLTVNLTISAEDNGSNKGTTSFQFQIDTVESALNDILLSDGYVQSSVAIQVDVNLSDPSPSSVIEWAAVGSTNFTNLSGTAWQGNVTSSLSGLGDYGVLNFTIQDHAGNRHNNDTYTYLVDNANPVMVNATVRGNQTTGGTENVSSDVTIVLTLSNESTEFNFTVYDRNLTQVNLTVDNVLLSQYGSAGNNTLQTVWMLLQSGLHAANWSAIDEADNIFTQNMALRIVKPENVTKILEDIKQNIGGGKKVKNVTLRRGGQDVSSNQSVLLNDTLSIVYDFNRSDINISVEIPAFNGTKVNFNNSNNYEIDTGVNESGAATANSSSGADFQQIVLFKNITKFIPESAFENGTSIFFDTPVGDLYVFYIEDDLGVDVHRITQCSGNSDPANGVSTVAQACYTNTTTNFTMYVPHLSGGGPANDTSAPNVTLFQSPTNNSIVASSEFDLNFTVLEAAPPTSGTFCNVSVTNQTTLALATSAFTQDGTNYNYTTTYTNMSNGEYDINISCIDLKNQSATFLYNITVTDTTDPIIQSITASQVSNAWQVTVTWTSDELTNATIVAGTNSSNLSTSWANSSFATSHTETITVPQTAQTWHYNISSWDYAGNRVDNGTFNVTITAVTSSSSDQGLVQSTFSGGGGGGGGGGGAGAAAFAKHDSRKVMFSSIEPGVEKVINVRDDKIPFTQIEFTLNEFQKSASFEIVGRNEDAPSGAPKVKAQKVYEYIEIVHQGIADEAFEGDVAIKFQITNAWIEENGVTDDQVVLMRLVENEWVNLPTKRVAESEDGIIYEAASPGMSYFAIAILGDEDEAAEAESVEEEEVEEAEGDADEAAEAEADDSDADAADSAADETGEEVVEKPTSKSWIIIAVIIVLLLAIGYMFLRRNQDNDDLEPPVGHRRKGGRQGHMTVIDIPKNDSFDPFRRDPPR